LATTQTFLVRVFPVNVAPVLAPVGDRTIDEEAALTFTASATDANPTDTLTFALVGAPRGATIDPHTAAFSWVPTEAQGPGTFTPTVRVTDDGSPTLSDEKTITITVREMNRASVLSPIGNRTFTEGRSGSFTATAADVDAPANRLTFSLAG